MTKIQSNFFLRGYHHITSRSIPAYINAVNEKQNLRQYKIKASNEYKKQSKYNSNQPKTITYQASKTHANKLPEIFNVKNKTRKRKKVDQMIIDMEQARIDDLKNQKDAKICDGIDEVDLISLNPLEIFKKQEQMNKDKQKVKKQENDEEKIKRQIKYKKEVDEALWDDSDNDNNDQDKEDKEDLFEGESEEGEDIDQQFEKFQIKDQKLSEKGNSNEAADEQKEADKIKNNTTTSKRIEIKEMNPEEIVTLSTTTRDYYKQKDRMLRVFQNKKSPMEIKRSSDKSANSCNQTKAQTESEELKIETKKNRQSDQPKRQSEMLSNIKFFIFYI